MEIYLRDIRITDVEDIHSYACIDKASKYQPWGPNTLEETQAHVMKIIKRESTTYHKVIVLKKTNRVIGAVEMTLNKINASAEIGYIIHPDYWGYGIATNISKKLLDYGFNKLGLNRIYATTDKRNIGSEKVLKKLGMKKEGLLRQNIKLREGYRDTLIYSILRYEYFSK